MNRYKPVWYEGMTLDPHHFQQWDRFYQGLLNDRVRSVVRFDWGLTALEIDKESLSNGVLALKSCSGVTRDGLAFDIPRVDAPPEARSIDKLFAPSEEKIGVFLGLPGERAGSRNCALDGSGGTRPTRFLMQQIPVNDDNTGSDERRIGVGRPGFALLFANEPMDEFSTLPIAEIVRSADGTFALSQRFIPPCLSLAASGNLKTIAHRLLELLVGKSNSLMERRRQQPSGQIEFTTADVTAFWLLHTINGVIPEMNHAYTQGSTHPETFYTILLTLAGQLSTFSPESDVRVRDLPLYDHAVPSTCFHELDSVIRSLLETVISTNVVALPIEKRSETVWICKVADESLFRSAQFVITTSTDKPERVVVEELPRKVKIAAPDLIDQLVISARPGLGMSHSAMPPIGLPTRPGLHYFRLEKSGSFWEGITRNGALAMFIPAEFRGMEIKVLAVKEKS